MPDFAAPPPLAAHHRFAWEAFRELSTCRPAGLGLDLGPGPIPWTAVKSYAATWAPGDRDALEDLAALIAAMDRAYLDEVQARQQQAAGRKR